MQPKVTEALTRAFFAEWARVGLGALSLEAVAKCAGVGKVALYRRWPSKEIMTFDRLETVGIALTDAPNTGSLEADPRVLLLGLRRVLRHPEVRRILPDFHAEMARSPEFSAKIRGRLQEGRRRRAEVVIRLAIERGDLAANTDVALGCDALGAMIYWRLIITDCRISTAEVERLAAFIAAGLKGTA